MNKTYNLRINEPYYTLVKKGEKTAEGRLYYPFLRPAKIGDSLLLLCGNKSLERQIKEVVTAKTFLEAFSTIDYKRAIPNAQSIEEAVKVYENFYSIEKQKQMGVVLFGLINKK